MLRTFLLWREREGDRGGGREREREREREKEIHFHDNGINPFIKAKPSWPNCFLKTSSLLHWRLNFWGTYSNHSKAG
jgi:hypothetical protein